MLKKINRVWVGVCLILISFGPIRPGFANIVHVLNLSDFLCIVLVWLLPLILNFIGSLILVSKLTNLIKNKLLRFVLTILIVLISMFLLWHIQSLIVGHFYPMPHIIVM